MQNKECCLVQYIELFKFNSDPNQTAVITASFPWRIIQEGQDTTQESLKPRPHFLNSIYSPTSSYYLNQYQHDKFVYESKQSDWYLSVPKQDIIYRRSFFKYQSGCQHYFSNAIFVCLICHKPYPCKYCHDDFESHKMKFQLIKCRNCANIQFDISTQCQSCDAPFGAQLCKVCCIITSYTSYQKPIFHCEWCQKCIVGLREHYQHCKKCNTCVKSYLFLQHNCQTMTQKCSLCMLSFQAGNDSIIQLDCGHYMHRTCRQGLITNNQYRCPICRKFLTKVIKTKIDRVYFNQFIAETLPDIWRERFLWIQCNECQAKFVAQQHTIGYRCINPDCLTFNTLVVGNFEESADAAFQHIQQSDNVLLTHNIDPLYPLFGDIQYYMEFFVGKYYEQLEGNSFELKFENLMVKLKLDRETQDVKVNCLRQLFNMFQDGYTIEQMADIIHVDFHQ